MQYDYMIYPKQFRAAKIPVEHNYCFFLMPFNERFDSVYGSIKESLSKINVLCNRADELSGSKPIINKILIEILRAQYVIVDLTDCNPNVFYELGIAHTFKDSRSVLLLKQRNSKVPFDITHLQYREYDPNNLKQLSSIIKTFLADNQQYNDLYEALYLKSVISLKLENNDNFVEYLQSFFQDNILLITQLLNDQSNEVEEKAIEEVLNRYQNFIHKTIFNKQQELLPCVLKLYSELLISSSAFKVAENHVRFFLEDFFSPHNLTDTMIEEYKTNMAITIAKRSKLLPVVMPWIIDYFKRSKTATIDLNRYRLEAFLMTSDCDEVNRAIISSMRSKDCHIREHMADIIGEKHLVDAKEVLFRQLLSEENFYSATSIIEAIGKLGFIDGVQVIMEWLNENRSIIIERKIFFILRHAKIAIAKLDDTSEHLYNNSFNALYGQYLNDSIPL